MTLRRDRSERSEEGFALVEILLAMIIMSLGVVGVISAIRTAVTTSDVHRRLTSTEWVARNYAEAIKNAALNPTGTYPKCPTTAQLTPPSFSTGDPNVPVPSIATVQYWIPDPTNPLQLGDPNNSSDPHWGTRTACLTYYQNLCGLTDVRSECDPGIQLVTFSVTTTDTDTRATTTSTQVVVRRGNN